MYIFLSRHILLKYIVYILTYIKKAADFLRVILLKALYSTYTVIPPSLPPKNPHNNKRKTKQTHPKLIATQHFNAVI